MVSLGVIGAIATSFVSGASLINYALASNGATASASNSANSNLQPSNTINGYRHTDNHYNASGTGGAWDSGHTPSVGSPDYLEVDLGASRTITEINVFTIADALNYNTDPTLSDTFTTYGILDFVVEYWNGAAWVNIATVTANDKVWRQFTFSAITTTKIRVYITAVAAGGGFANARIVEVEAKG